MACSACAKRREAMKRQARIARERIRKVIDRAVGKSTGTADPRAEQPGK